MCLEVDRSVRIGSLLRLTLRSIDGRPALDTLARVVWRGAAGGGFLLGLALIDCEGRPEAPAPPRPAHPRRHLRRIA
jgi:hypothetical protein